MIGRNLALAVAFVALVTAPAWTPGIYYINVSSQILFYAIFALGLNILVGYGGLVSLGHVALLGVGAYSAGAAVAHGWGVPVVLLYAGAVAALVAVPVGLPALRFAV